MKPLYRGLILAGLHVTLVASLGAKLLFDRATLPRVWVRAGPVDPSLPIRGRYVQLRLEVAAPAFPAPPAGIPRGRAWATLTVENDQLVAQPSPEGRGHVIFWTGRAGESGVVPVAVLAEPVAFFIPEHVSDPSRRPPGEELWVEVTVPTKGPPRPIRLGVKKNDVLAPLQRE